MFTITLCDNRQLSPDQIVAVVSLVNSIWPHKERTGEELVDGFADAHDRYFAPYTLSRPPIRYLAWKDERLVGHAFTFERPVILDGAETSVMALAQVCVSPVFRGHGLGVELVRRAFQRLHGGEFPLSIFQTTIPAFYEKLGARIADNRFVNSRNQNDPNEKPWKDGWIMIYPADYAWPEGPIDLNGPGY